MGSVKEAFVFVLDAKANIRDYHGKIAVHYWTGSTDVFSKPGSQSGEVTCNCWCCKKSLCFHVWEFMSCRCMSHVCVCLYFKWLPLLCVSILKTDASFINSGGKWSRGRRGQRYAQFSSLLMSRSRSNGHLNMEQDSQPLPLSRGRSSSWLMPLVDAPRAGDRGRHYTLNFSEAQTSNRELRYKLGEQCKAAYFTMLSFWTETKSKCSAIAFIQGLVPETCNKSW